MFNTSYRRFLARRCCRFNGAAGAAAGAAGAGRAAGGDAGAGRAAGAAVGAAGGIAGGNVAGGGHCRGALWPIDTHRARHKQSHLETGRPPPRSLLCPGLESWGPPQGK